MANNTGFLNENLNRAYPLQNRPAMMTRIAPDLSEVSIELPPAAIADFGCILGATLNYTDNVEYDANAHVVYLATLSRAADLFTFVFKCTATDESQYLLTFQRELTADDYTNELVSLELADSVNCGTGGFWDGFLVTGQMAAIAAILPAGYSLQGTADTTAIEPGVVQSCQQRFVRSINVANKTRTRATAADGCDGETSTEQIIPIDNCLTGDLRIQAGFNCKLLQDTTENSLTLGAAVGAGAGEPCDEVPIYSAEEKPDGSDFYTGGPTCRGLIKTINGVGGPDLVFQAGPGVTITATEARLKVAVDLHDLQICSTP